AEPGLRRLDALLVRGVELLVVRGHGGVRDPEGLLCHRSHLRARTDPPSKPDGSESRWPSRPFILVVTAGTWHGGRLRSGCRRRPCRRGPSTRRSSSRRSLRPTNGWGRSCPSARTRGGGGSW